MTAGPQDSSPGDPRPGAAPPPDCLCMGLGPQLTALLRSLVPAAGLAETLRGTELEALTFLKSIIDQRIASLSGGGSDTRGTRVVID